jgi:hypothetical protein
MSPPHPSWSLCTPLLRLEVPAVFARCLRTAGWQCAKPPTPTPTPTLTLMARRSQFVALRPRHHAGELEVVVPAVRPRGDGELCLGAGVLGAPIAPAALAAFLLP